MSTIRTNAILDAAGGNTAQINGITPALASQAEAQAGSDNTKLMTPLRAAQAIAALVPAGFGQDQTWQSVTRDQFTSYQNTTGRPIMAVFYLSANTSGSIRGFSLQVSTNNSTWVTVGGATGSSGEIPVSATIVIPNGYYYRWFWSGGSTSATVLALELR